MKKFIFLFVCLFIFSFSVKADDTFYWGEQVPNMYIEAVRGSEVHNGAPFILYRRSDLGIVYCINPFLTMNTTTPYKAYTYNDPIFKLTDYQLNKLNIISYFGYGYKNHTDIKWFGITQYYLWKSLGYDDVYFTDVYHGNRAERYQSEVNELETLVNDYYKLPSFNNKSFEYEPNKTYELIDTNNVLSNYQIKESNVSASINNNKLTINTGGGGNYKITFVRKSPINRNYILYNLEGAQAVLYPGKINDITFSISIEVNSGSITINKYDVENKKRLEANLNGSTFGIYKNNVLISELTINSSNTTSIYNLPFGSYIVKELNSSKGYNKDTQIYNVTISKTNKDIIINSYSKVIEGNLTINKYFGSEDNYKIDNDAMFEIYNAGNLIKTVSGNSEEILEYGTYLIKQVNGRKYYDFINDFNVSILEEKNYKYNFYTDKTDEIKAYEELLNRREESLNKKEQELLELQNKIELEKDNLMDLKQEINEKEIELDNKKSEIKEKEQELSDLEIFLEQEKEKINNDRDLLELKKEELRKLEEELNNMKSNLESSLDDINEKEQKLNKLEEELNLLNNKLIDREKELNELQETINEKEILLNKSKQELDILNDELKKKEIEIKKKEDNLTKLQENALVVEVPNTYKKSYNKLISILLIIIGSIFIIVNKKKTTDC